MCTFQHCYALFPVDIFISFSSPEYVTPENGGTVEVCLMTSEVLSQPVTLVLLAHESLPPDATGTHQTQPYLPCHPLHHDLVDGADFIGGEYRVQIPARTREQCTDIPVIDDSLAFEGDEVFVVKFDISQLPDGVEPGPSNTTTVRVIDDDGKFLAVLLVFVINT